MVRKLSLFMIVFFVALALAGCNLPQVSMDATVAPPKDTAIPQPTAADTATAIPQPTVADTATPTLNLVDNTIYLGKLEGKDALFITNKSLQNYWDGDGKKNSPTVGAVILSNNAEQRQPFEFKNLEDAQYLFTLPDETFIRCVTFDDSRERLFFSLISGVSRLRNDVYLFIPATHDYQKIWTNEMNKHSRYVRHRGTASFAQVAGNYLVLAVSPCYACDGTTGWPLMVVLNISTGAEKVLDGFGNVSVNLDTNKVSYQKLKETKNACDPSPGCNDGYFLKYAPAGDFIEASLP